MVVPIRLPAGQFSAGTDTDMDEQELWAAVKTAAENALPDFLPRHRWYPAKDAGCPEVKLSVMSPLPGAGDPAAIAVWQVTPRGSQPLYLSVPLAVVAESDVAPEQIIATVQGAAPGVPAVIADAVSSDGFVRRWLELLANPDAVATSPLLRARRTGCEFRFDPATVPIHRSQAEQSNTSVRIGEAAILKFIRKVEAGAHPELEIGRYLAQAGYGAAPPLLGWAELLHAGGEPYALCMLQEFVPNQGDGWSWILDRLQRGIPGGEQDALNETRDWLTVLALRLAELHRVFAAGSSDPAFTPEPVTSTDLRHWQTAARSMAQRAYAGMSMYAAEGRSAEIAVQFRNLHQAVLGEIDNLTTLPEGFYKTRHHGDFHLGQVLVAGKDAVILDFEGEPLRSLAERRAKHCVLRDVAGVLRSLSYAGATLLRHLPDSASPVERAAAAQWQKDSSDAFVSAYFDAAHGIKSLPSTRTDADVLLRFFVLEKALYEIAYELANRPGWVDIPLQGVVSIFSQQ